MLLFVLAYLGGALTIASPCILPVLAFVRQTGPIVDRTFTIAFIDPHVQAYAFTFG